ncbi:MAG: anti-sigma factor family protein [bacterium]
MNCLAFRKFLDESESAARSQDLPVALQEHLLACSSCQRDWHLQQRLLAALEREPEHALPPAFTAAVMAELPVAPLKKRRLDFEDLLMVVLIPGAFAALWYTMRTLWPHLISTEKLKTIYGIIEKMGQDFLQMMFGKVPEVMIHAFGREMMGQAGQVILISVVTFLVAKSAVLLENRIRRMLNG